MPTLASWTAIATFLAAGIAAITLSVSLLFRAGQLWERVSRVVSLAETNQEDLQALNVEIQRLWSAIAETVDPPEDLVPRRVGEGTPEPETLIGDEEDDNHDAD